VEVDSPCEQHQTSIAFVTPERLTALCPRSAWGGRIGMPNTIVRSFQARALSFHPQPGTSPFSVSRCAWRSFYIEVCLGALQVLGGLQEQDEMPMPGGDASKPGMGSQPGMVTKPGGLGAPQTAACWSAAGDHADASTRSKLSDADPQREVRWIGLSRDVGRPAMTGGDVGPNGGFANQGHRHATGSIQTGASSLRSTRNESSDDCRDLLAWAGV